MEIYAEISKEMRRKLDYDGFSLCFPVGVTASRYGRGLHIECEEYMIDMIEDLLDGSGIPYQEMDKRESKDDEEEDKYGRKKKKRSSW